MSSKRHIGRVVAGWAWVLCALSCGPGPDVDGLSQGRQPLPAGNAHRKVPGVVIAHRPASSKVYIGSPSIAVLPNGTYVASHDLFGPGPGSGATHLYTSTDRGRTWQHEAALEGQHWSTLFVHGGALYLLGTTGQYGSVAIRRSQDGGRTWTQPLDATTGLLRADGKFHSAPVPIVEHDGRLWRSMEMQRDPVRWPQGFRAFMMSVPVGADLLQASNWTSSEPLAGDQRWLDGHFNGWLEGNAVVTPDGSVVDILRVDSDGPSEVVALAKVGGGGARTTFDPATGFVAFPGGAKKFTIRYDHRSQLYWSLANYVPPELAGGAPRETRNTLALISSPDLKEWTVRSVVLHEQDRAKHAFQYVDWHFEGDDLIAVSRTAFDDEETGANSFHNANYLTFHRVPKFREATPVVDRDDACGRPPKSRLGSARGGSGVPEEPCE